MRRRKARSGAPHFWRLRAPRDELLLRAKARISCSLRRFDFGHGLEFSTACRLSDQPSLSNFARMVRSLDPDSLRITVKGELTPARFASDISLQAGEPQRRVALLPDHEMGDCTPPPSRAVTPSDSLVFRVGRSERKERIVQSLVVPP